LQQRISAGSTHSCAITAAGGVICWGGNFDGQLGNGSNADSLTGVPVSGLVSDVAAVGAGGFFTCALTTVGGVKCWGINGDGTLGNNSTISSAIPVAPIGLEVGIVALSVGYAHACALTAMGGVKCWGNNGAGQLGDGTKIYRSAPVDVASLTSGVIAISAGRNHTCAVTDLGRVKCWGENNSGQLGNNSIVDSNFPVDVSGLSGVSSVSTAINLSCALTTAGSVKCWGNVLGDAGTHRVPADMSGWESGVTAISAGESFACALLSGSGIQCVGGNFNGILGDGTNITTTTPVTVSGLTSGANAISSGIAHACAKTIDDKVKCWGVNQFGQLGNNSTTNSNVPVNVIGSL
jgi:alpha-tubulin suppressor-like RCC1 family protein